jgi:hypothetical protein
MLSQADLIRELTPPLDTLLIGPLIREYESLERRFVLGDWEPAELDGGQFCEITARILYHQDSGNLNLSKEFGECLAYLENDQAKHLLPTRKPYLHVARVLRTVYKFRSDRGAVHISADYEPNHMDAKWVLESCRWVFAEMLRLFWKVIGMWSLKRYVTCFDSILRALALLVIVESFSGWTCQLKKS